MKKQNLNAINVSFQLQVPIIEQQGLTYTKAKAPPHDPVELGSGTFGRVYLGRYQGKLVAIKRLHITNPKIIENLKKEAALMRKVNSPYTVELIGLSLEPEQTALVMEYLSGGSLFKLLHSGKKMSWESRYRLAFETASGVYALHQQRIIHRDLKSLNVVLDGKGHAKITDFGLSKLRGQITSISQSSHKSKGTPAYKAPELHQYDEESEESGDEEEQAVVKKKAPYSPYSDIYALGVIFWELASRQIPFDGLSTRKIEKKLLKGKHEKLPKACPEAFGALILSCWKMRPSDRPKTPEVVQELKRLWEDEKKFDLPIDQPIAEKNFPPAPWHLSPALKKAMQKDPCLAGQKYVVISLSPEDTEAQKVAEIYGRKPIGGYELDSVQAVYNPRLDYSFRLRVSLLQDRYGNGFFNPSWKTEKGASKAHRQKTYDQFTELCEGKDNGDPSFANVQIAPWWHVTDKGALPSIFKGGYASAAVIDAGFFGKGIYFAGEAEYACRVYSKFHQQPALLLNWVAAFSAYPVIEGDKPRLMGKSNFEKHDAHFIPVIPGSDNPEEVNFYPCPAQVKYKYTELVVFHEQQGLPRYVVTLRKTAPAPAIVFKDLRLLEACSHGIEEEKNNPPAVPAAQSRNPGKASASNNNKQHKNSGMGGAGMFGGAEVKAQPFPEKEVQLFLRHIVYGEQDIPQSHESVRLHGGQGCDASKAEKEIQAQKAACARSMIKKHGAGIAFAKGKHVDIEDRYIKGKFEYRRRFEDISGWQLALWLRDWHMWKMILAEVQQDKEAPRLLALAKQQYTQVKQGQLKLWIKDLQDAKERRIEDKTELRGFNLLPLINAYQTYLNKYDAWSWEQRSHHWCKVIGAEQRKLPAHVLQEYNRPDRSMDPTPEFKEATRPVMSQQCTYKTRCDAEGHGGYFSDGCIPIGVGAGVARYSLGRRGMQAVGYAGWHHYPFSSFGISGRSVAVTDENGCQVLNKTRGQQFDELSQTLDLLLKANDNLNNTPAPMASGHKV